MTGNIAELYSKQATAFGPLASEIRKYAKRGHCVVDLGSGSSPYFKVISTCVGKEGKIILVDCNRQMVNYCKKKYGSRKNVEVKLLDAEKLSDLGESPDIIFAGLVFQFTNEKQSLPEAKKSLKKGGKIIFAIPLYRNGITLSLDKKAKLFQTEFYKNINEKLKPLRKKASFGYVNGREETYRKIMTKIGLKALKWKVQPLEKSNLEKLLSYYRIPWRSKNIVNLPFGKRYAIIANALKKTFREYPDFLVERYYLLATVQKK